MPNYYHHRLLLGVPDVERIPPVCSLSKIDADVAILAFAVFLLWVVCLLLACRLCSSRWCRCRQSKPDIPYTQADVVEEYEYSQDGSEEELGGFEIPLRRLKT